MEQKSHAREFLAVKSAIRKARLRRRRVRIVLVSLLAVGVLIVAYLINSVYLPNDARLTGPVEFEQASLGDVMTALERKYAVEIKIPENLRDCKFTGRFYSDSPEQVISFIAVRFGADVTMTEEGAFAIDGGECR